MTRKKKLMLNWLLIFKRETVISKGNGCIVLSLSGQKKMFNILFHKNLLHIISICITKADFDNTLFCGSVSRRFKRRRRARVRFKIHGFIFLSAAIFG